MPYRGLPPPVDLLHELRRGGGVYVLKFPDGCVYVGASFKVKKRLEKHLIHLRTGTAQNLALQAAWNASGGDCEVSERFLPLVTPEELAVLERILIREWVEKVGRSKVLNRVLDPCPILSLS